VTGSRVVATTGGIADGWGAGLSLAEGPFSIRLSRISGNQISATGTTEGEARGGGLLGTATADIDVSQSTIHANRAASAGAGGSMSTGGGIEMGNATVAVRSSTVSGNVATAAGQALGGGLLLGSGGPHVVTNSTIAGNRATGATARGGGIDSSSTVTLTSATIARNSAKIGGGIYVEGGATTLRATILALNTAPSGANCSQSVASAGRNLVASTLGCAFVTSSTDKTGVAAKIGLLKSNGGPTQTIALNAGSPALNAIPKAECPFGRDQRGVRRPQGARCDIGSYERKT
jgi:hypothetical protein